MQIDILVNCEGWPDETVLYSLAQNAVSSAVEFSPLIHDKDAELSILFTNDEEIQQLNQDWRQKERPTNVLSFPGGDLVRTGEVHGPLLGDIILALETCSAEAALAQKPFNNHVTHLMVHGLLHLFGYDHETEEEAAVMENLEIAILAQMNIANPYEESID